MSGVGAIRGLTPRLNVVGRIRAGAQVEGRNGKKRPTSIDTFRFTSQDRDLIDAIAAHYRGEVAEWIEPKSPGRQWEVVTEASKIDVILPPNCLDGPTFELWSGGGRLRRCDTENCEVLADGPEGPEYQLRASCICEAEAVESGDKGEVLYDEDGQPIVDLWSIKRACSLKMRLTVLLPQFQMAGGWRIDTGSRNAAEKIPAMVDMVRHLQTSGLPGGFLYIQKSQAFGGRREFNEILLGLKQTYDEISQQLTAGPSATPVALDTARPALAAPEPEPEPAQDPPPPLALVPEVINDGAPSDHGGVSTAAFLLTEAEAKGLTKAKVLRQAIAMGWGGGTIDDLAADDAMANDVLDWIEGL